ncbi:TlpA family protein disulfide reductase [Thalassobellus citreus]|uniref:TlpA family protein disulfide reductase n=1 Tax=Thalassobellus citreus TaxID=3367752 RepID=UPI0037917C27
MKHFFKIKRVTLASLIFIATIITSCKNTDVQVKGFIKTDKDKIVLSRLGEVITESNIDDAKHFSLEIKDLKKGYYNIDNYLLYLAPGFNLDIDNNDSIPKITGVGSKENNVLFARIQQQINYHPSSKIMMAKFQDELEPFKLYLKNMVKELDANLNDKDLDPDFVASEKLRTKVLQDALFSQFVAMHGIDYSKERLSDKYLMSLTKADWADPKTMVEYRRLAKIDNKDCFSREFINKVRDSINKDFNWNDEVLYSMSSLGYTYLYDNNITSEGYALRNEKGKDYNVPQSILKRDVVLKKVTSNPIKKEYLTKYTNQIIKVNPDHAEAAYKLFLEQNPTEVQKELVEQTYKNFKSVVVGKPSAKFVNYKTPEDKAVSLNDLLGKYVYIDVWATWCGPCKKEIPYLKTLEEELHGKNIEFVSISVDTEKNRGKWKQMVKDMELKGVQIMADKDFSSDFIKAYNIAAIPRFILIDPKGNLVSSDELRPSDPKLKEKLEVLLMF